MKNINWFLPILLMTCPLKLFSQNLTNIVTNKTTSVKSQEGGTCWNYATNSLLESEELRKGKSEINLSERFNTRNVYIEKARNYLLRMGKTQFGEGSLGHDVLAVMLKYGAMPEEVFQKNPGDPGFIDGELKAYLDSVMMRPALLAAWQQGYQAILDRKLGTAPETFDYKGKNYTPKTFAEQVLKYNATDYVGITSFTHHPFYTSFSLEVPDNWSGGAYYNIPLDEMIELAQHALKSGYTVVWDGDVNEGFDRDGFCFATTDTGIINADKINEMIYSQESRQLLFERLVTTDDHIMHIVGLDKSPSGRYFFRIKNSYGDGGAFKGYLEMSVPYFAINTVSLVFPKAALPKALKKKMKIE